MATAEFAVALPAVVLVLVVALSAIGAGIDQIRCVDAARLAARALARGDSQGAAAALARGAAPSGASVTLSAGGDLATAMVSVSRRAPVVGFSWVVAASATAPREAVPP
ncbi:MAG: hypothetical protein IPI13_09895 [Actinomycetales bacterium]|jgi:hypothetical protein|uniref:Pilus assembly protein TadE n=1 Tax=Candidatus Phosphoribacter hodrii TaxID=2953743 RepID=A0A935IP23_9MICO|nr:hypothetical protein [Candidatus Phosphoribacter hodrii]HOA58042.1 TadE family type IV pilus minor pilin [Dermatophilaceae bacterium]MBK7273454.1 hypothetical protein [Candidatus Phosphoribacter hodrii]MBL0005447.1 hypothetical protein [Candidatus Phosphoribacter hodrii]HPZ67692.1 TadE family type IV pilus minor pilin [Dermatophilaceae bacterium]